MAPVPKRKHSKSRKNKRIASKRESLPMGIKCANCSKLKLPHRICVHCNS